MKKLICGSIWFFAANIVMVAGLILSSFTYLNLPTINKLLAQERRSAVLAASIEKAQEEEISTEEINESSDEATFVAQAGAKDARATIVANFIERNDSGKNSPLQPYDEYGQLFVDIADEYGLDFRLLPAIARKESTFCKSNIAKTYYNCFGYGVPSSGITEAGKFDSYEEGIRVVAKSLKTKYIDQGLTDPVAIMQKYCPPSADGDGTWANHLNQWLAEMRYDDKALGVEKKENVDLLEFAP